MFHIGQKVVYVGGGKQFPDAWGPSFGFVRGNTYTIREIDPIYIFYRGMVGIRVEEISVPLVMWRGAPFEAACLADRFRPLIERKTDTGMAILEEIRKRESAPDTERVRKPLTASMCREP